jgi:hypothetical protein
LKSSINIDEFGIIGFYRSPSISAIFSFWFIQDIYRIYAFILKSTGIKVKGNRMPLDRAGRRNET